MWSIPFNTESQILQDIVMITTAADALGLFVSMPSDSVDLYNWL